MVWVDWAVLSWDLWVTSKWSGPREGTGMGRECTASRGSHPPDAATPLICFLVWW